MQRIANVLQPKSQKLQPKPLKPLQCKVFDLRPAFQKGSGRMSSASVLNPRLNGNRCISTKNEKIAVTVTLYQNNRDGVARFGYMDTNATFYANLCKIFANFAFIITLDLHE